MNLGFLVIKRGALAALDWAQLNRERERRDVGENNDEKKSHSCRFQLQKLVIWWKWLLGRGREGRGI